MIKGILFDFDYTLGDSTMGIVQSANYALEQLGYTGKSEDAIKRTIGLSLTDTFLSLEPDAPKEEVALFASYFKKKADEVMVNNTILYEGTVDILANLKSAGYRIGIVTTKYSYRIKDIFNKYNSLHMLDVIVGGDNVKVEKPSPEGILYALGKISLDKSEVLYVGDSLVDAKAAQNAQVLFAAVLTGTTGKEEFDSYPHGMIGNCIQDVYQYVKVINSK